MGFLEIRFPTDISYGSGGGPVFATDIVTTQGGHEQRNANWLTPRAQYNVAYGVKTQKQLDALLSFFRIIKGRACGFRFKDWADYRAVNQPIGMGDGATAMFQLVKAYVNGGVSATRAIHKPVAGTVQVYVNGAVQQNGVTIDYAMGTVTFTVPPANGTAIAADFEFDVPVRFDTDALPVRLDAYGIFSCLDVPIVEIRI